MATDRRQFLADATKFILLTGGAAPAGAWG